ncbi:hypothetical protein Ait01nite_074010 [Actinoplanes italicus]|nr:hypothetical protein Ait01nite_074010 [Actinoplanes italicus]
MVASLLVSNSVSFPVGVRQYRVSRGRLFISVAGMNNVQDPQALRWGGRARVCREGGTAIAGRRISLAAGRISRAAGPISRAAGPISRAAGPISRAAGLDPGERSCVIYR